MKRFLELLAAQSKRTVLTLSLCAVVMLGALDYVTGPFSFILFYLIPICYAAWFAGARSGVFTSMAAIFAWFIDDMQYFSSNRHPAAPYWNAFTIFISFLLIVYILFLLKRAFEREKELARIDYLTGIANVRYFSEFCAREVGRLKRYNHPLTLVYMDVDNFKLVNDRLGHNEGDSVLRAIAQTIKNNVRVIDLPARLGGDEFAVLLPETGYEGAKVVIQRLRDDIAAVLKNAEWPITVSIGAVTCTKPPESFDELFKITDELMYAAKTNGKNKANHVIWDS